MVGEDLSRGVADSHMLRMTEREWLDYTKTDEDYQERWNEIHRLYEDKIPGMGTYTKFLSELPQEEQEELYARLVIEFG